MQMLASRAAIDSETCSGRALTFQQESLFVDTVPVTAMQWRQSRRIPRSSRHFQQQLALLDLTPMSNDCFAAEVQPADPTEQLKRELAVSKLQSLLGGLTRTKESIGQANAHVMRAVASGASKRMVQVVVERIGRVHVLLLPCMSACVVQAKSNAHCAGISPR